MTPTWIARGATLSGDVENDQFGATLALSDDGRYLAVGAPSGATLRPGYARVFQHA